MTIKAVIFDMDGVLIEAKDWHFAALNRALAHFGYQIHRHEHLTVYDGLPTRKKLEVLTTVSGLPRGLHDFINTLKQAYTMEFIHTQCRPRFCHERALSELKRRGYGIAVASNSTRHTIEVMMERAHLTPYLDFFLSNQDVNHAKPDPEIYTKSIHKLGLSPAECLVVEDNENGIRAAMAAGAHVMVVSEVEAVNLPAIERQIRLIDSDR